MSSVFQVSLLLALVIAAAKGAGALSKRAGQPAVFGELLAGILLGPSLLDVIHWPVFTDSDYLERLLGDLAQLGVIFLMFLAGLETDLQALRRVGAAAVCGAVGGVVLPFLAGWALASAFGFGTYEGIFIGTILTATSVSITAQTLLEMGQLRSREGTTILGSAVIDDLLGMLILAVVVAFHQGTGGNPAAGHQGASLVVLLVRMLLFFAVALVLGRWLVPATVRWASRWPAVEAGFAVALVMGLLYAAAAEELGGVAAITGAYAAGALLGLHGDLREAVMQRLSVLAHSLFVPIFFVHIGLQTHFAQAAAQSGWGFLLAVVVAAIMAKVAGSALGVRPFGFGWEESLRVGIGMISRGEVALMVTGIGLQSGVISPSVFSVMVVMTLVTTLVTPILLRWSFNRKDGPGPQTRVSLGLSGNRCRPGAV